MKKRPGKSGKKGKPQSWADSLTERAKKENYPARSVYKLKEIRKKFKVIRKGDTVLDLGCAPGSWLLYAAQAAGGGGKVVGVDLKPLEIPLPENAAVVCADIHDIMKDLGQYAEGGFHAVLNDMAPATTGRKDVDAARSYELCAVALQCARTLLSENGCFVCKIFQGQEFKTFEKEVKSIFAETRMFKPESCRKASKEIYIIGKGKIKEDE